MQALKGHCVVLVVNCARHFTIIVLCYSPRCVIGYPRMFFTGEGVGGKRSLVQEEIENLLINNELPCTDLVTELMNSLIYFILISNNFMAITYECPV